MHGELRLARQAESFVVCMSLPVVLACYLDSGETRIIKIRIAKKNTENLKNHNVLYTQKCLALRYTYTPLLSLCNFSNLKARHEYVTRFGKTLRMGFFQKMEFDAWFISSSIELSRVQV